MSKSARDMDPNQYAVLFGYARGLEEVTRNNSECEVIFRIEVATNKVGFQTMRSSGDDVAADWTTAVAAGKNIHVSAHKDRDFFESVVTAHQTSVFQD